LQDIKENQAVTNEELTKLNENQQILINKQETSNSYLYLLNQKADEIKELIREFDAQGGMTVEEFKNYQKDKEDIVISTHKTFAHPRNGCLCFKIEYQGKSLVYATDKESYVGSDKKFIEFAAGADLLIHDSQYTDQEYTSSISPRQGFGHSTFKMAIETAKLAKVKQLAMFHYDPNYDDNFLKSIEDDILKNNENVFFSREGLEITL
jgi:ribonuclease BN (tRNA processing enzyme)